MRRFKAATLSAVAALSAVACSGSDDKSTTDETSATDSTPDGTGTTVADTPVQVVKIGYAFPDLAAFAVLNKSFAIGDPKLQAEAVIDGWQRDGLLPPGIQIELVAAPYNIIEPAAKLGGRIRRIPCQGIDLSPTAPALQQR